MQRLFLSLAVAFLGCLAIPASLNAQEAGEFIDRGNAWENKGDHDMAIANYNQALRVADPNDSYNICTAYMGRGIAWYKKGEYDKAVADYNQALAVNPNFADAYNNRGIAWNGKGEHDKAIADYDQALRDQSQ